ncbi:hypothetical protein HDU96_008102 [Phlyctochytrium bullatum]|nr:hypothetical protein HDU96_008102 [Phlyctochytrium bullatum]
MSIVTSSYVRYKKATGEFVGWLRSSLSDPGQSVKISANRIRETAESIRAAGTTVPSSVMRALETAIDLREEVRTKRTRDDGHSFFLEMLKDVRKQLLPLTKSDGKAEPPERKEKKQVKKEEKKYEALVNQFSVLAVEVEAATADELELERDREVAAAAEKEEPDGQQMHLEWKENEIDIEDDTQWVAVKCFLEEAAELMEHAVEAWFAYRDGGGAVPILVPTAATNLAISLVGKLINTLQLDYPHLQSWSAIVVVMYFDDSIHKLMRKYPRIDYATAIRAVTYARVYRKQPAVIKEITRLLQISKKEVESIITAVMALDKKLTGTIFQDYRILTLIEWTHVTLMRYSSNDARKGDFESKWDENTKPVPNFYDLFEEYAMDNVFPALRILASQFEDNPDILRQPQVTPLIELFYVYVRTKHVSMELSFAMYASFWATIVYQGDMRCAKLAIDTSIKLSNLRARIDTNSKYIMFDSNDVVKKALKKVQQWLTCMTEKSYARLTTRQKFVGLYNPYLAGQQLTFAYYCLGLDFGHMTLNSMFQATLILHYYNAFRVLAIIKELPLLEFLMEQYSRGKSMFVGGRPTEKGHFIKAFLMSLGYEVPVAVKIAQVLKQESTTKSQTLKSIPRKSKASYKLINRDRLDSTPILPSLPPVISNDYTDFPQECFDDVSRCFKHLETLIMEDHDTSWLGYDLFSLGRLFLEIGNKLIVKALGFEEVAVAHRHNYLRTAYWCKMLFVDESKWLGIEPSDYEKQPFKMDGLYQILTLCDTGRDMDMVRIAAKVLELSMEGLGWEDFDFL